MKLLQYEHDLTSYYYRGVGNKYQYQRKKPNRENLEYIIEFEYQNKQVHIEFDFEMKSQVVGQIKTKKEKIEKYDLDLSKMQHICKIK